MKSTTRSTTSCYAQGFRFRALSEALQENESILTLSLQGSRVGEDGAAFLADIEAALRHNNWKHEKALEKEAKRRRERWRQRADAAARAEGGSSGAGKRTPKAKKGRKASRGKTGVSGKAHKGGAAALKDEI